MTQQTVDHASAALDEQELNLLFGEAYTTYAFSDEPVDAELVARVYEDARWAPTAMNIQPLRLTVVPAGDAREALVEQMAEGNKEKTAAAPMTVVAAFDPNWHVHMPHLAPHREGLREDFEGKPEAREAMGRTNALLQIGYFVLALRAHGLQVGPMAGFNAAGVDEAFHTENGWKTLLALNIGQAPNAEDENAQRPRAGRLTFDQAAQVV
ncbi:malonic semialdehyde reductase [Citricoccus muralis]|uniref:Malonic semialdehyde reductase n=1 Tax=Citricoccus muralis TaxID=169134 RepID=A0ABY8H834_9MICC|nr:malonic semialdehyde reductase [Citricoccus muralis]WFP17081.1 malonic semialdehyde reductase [Citricoccus muralis]